MGLWNKIIKPFLPRPERIRRANQFLPVVHSEDVKGAPFKVQTMEELYSLSRFIECLEEDVTIITVKESDVLDGDGNPTKQRYELVDASAIDGGTGMFLPEAWEIFSTGSPMEPQPAAPTNPVTDDLENTFTFTFETSVPQPPAPSAIGADDTNNTFTFNLA